LKPLTLNKEMKMTQKQIDDKMASWRVITPVLLVLLTGIMSFTGYCVTSYLGQINSSISSIGGDLKVFMRDTGNEIHKLDSRMDRLEIRVLGIKDSDTASSLEN
jgi:hypothetical protein